MWSNKQFFTDKLIAQKSCAGRFVNYPDTSGHGTSGQVSLYWNNIQALSRKNFMDNFRINFKITVSGTSSASNDIYFMKDINHAMRTLVSINGSISQEVEGWALTPILKCYSPKYKSKDNLNVNDDWVYSTSSTNALADNDAGKRGYKAGGTPGGFTFTAETNVPLMHYLLLNGLGGVNSLNIRIILDNNLLSIMHCGFTDSPTVTVNEATITYDEYETSTEDFYIGIPYFVFYNTALAGSNGSATTESQTRNTNGACSYVFQHISQLGSLLTTKNNYDLQKPLLMNKIDVDVNNNTNCWNVTGPVQAYGRCSAVDYQGSLTDFYNNMAVNSFGCVLKIDMHKLPVNISTSEIFRFNSRVIASTSSVTNLYLSTVYCYPAVLHLSEAESEIKYISYDAFVGELADYDPLDDMIVGAGFWDKVKSFGKKVIQYAPGLINKAGEIANVVAPGSKTAKGFEKASQISNILTGTSTSLF